VLWAYTALISLTVVFSGDHYVADVVAGLLFAGAATFAMRRLPLPLRRRLDGLAPSTETAVDEAEQSAA
jgi:membrane-associated phospholipid phosphatase